MKVVLKWRDGVNTRFLFNLVKVCSNKRNHFKLTQSLPEAWFQRDVLTPVEVTRYSFVKLFKTFVNLKVIHKHNYFKNL